MLPLKELRKQIMNLRVKICAELLRLLQEETRLSEDTTCCSSQPPASHLPLQLPPAHLPQTLCFFCTVLADHFVLVYEINLCLLQRKQKVSIFTGFCDYCGPGSTRTCQGPHTIFIAEKLGCGLRHSSCEPPQKQSERKTLKED